MPQDQLNSAEKENKKNGLFLVFFVSATSVIAALLIYYTFNHNANSKLKVDVAGQIFELDITNDEVNIRDLIDQLFADEDHKIQTRALLREHYNLYYIEDPNLINLIGRLDRNEYLSVELRHLLFDLKGPFKRDFHTFYNVEDAEILDAIGTLGFDHEVSRGLRRLLALRQGPFAPQEQEIEISVPSGNHIQKGFAGACRKNTFFRKYIRIFDATRQHSINVYVKNPIGCRPEQRELLNLLHLSFEDMRDLVGQSPIDRTEHAYAVVELD